MSLDAEKDINNMKMVLDVNGYSKVYLKAAEYHKMLCALPSNERITCEELASEGITNLMVEDKIYILD